MSLFSNLIVKTSNKPFGSLLSSLVFRAIICSIIVRPLSATIRPGMEKTSENKNSSEGEFVIGFINIDNEENAFQLAKKLVDREPSLVACVNIIPKIRSIYKWKGKVEDATETTMIVKTRAAKSSEVIEFVRANHPYEVPEVIFTPITDGNPAYLKWVGETVN